MEGGIGPWLQHHQVSGIAFLAPWLCPFLFSFFVQDSDSFVPSTFKATETALSPCTCHGSWKLSSVLHSFCVRVLKSGEENF